jgi:hypothetical protein
MAKENRVVSYPSPLNVRNIEKMAEQKQMSKSQVINEALTNYFKNKPTTY